jgi:hypothetical protein
MGRRRKDENHSPQKNNLIQDSKGNEENGYLVPDSKRTMTNVTKEPSNVHKKTFKGGITEKFMVKVVGIVNHNVQNALKKFQDTKNKEHEKTETNKYTQRGLQQTLK